MAVHEGKSANENHRTGTFNWNSDETTFLLTGSNRSLPFAFGGFECFLCTVQMLRQEFGLYTVFYLTNKSPIQFSSFYTFSLIDNKGNKCCTLSGIMNWKSETIQTGKILMTIFHEQLPQEMIKSLRISWFEDESTVSEKSVQVDSDESITLLETLSKDFGCFLESKSGTDCVLRVGKEEFSVHRQVLAARSLVFKAMFRHDTSESRNGTVDIPDVEAGVMNAVLFYVYTGKIRNLTKDSAIPMYVAADKYALIELKDKCLDFLMHCLTMENFCDAAVLAHTHGEAKLEDKIVLFIEERVKEIMDNENWKSFLKNNTLLGSRLLCSAMVAKQEKMDKMPLK